MREAWLFGGAFWGTMLVVVGGLLILRTAFNLQIPLFRTLVAVMLIYVGISLLLGGPVIRSQDHIIFEERTVAAVSHRQEYNVLFSQGTIDFSQLVPEGRESYEVNTVFATGTIILKADTAAEVRVNAAFAGTDLPHGHSVVLGETSFRTGPEDATDRLVIKASVVFGSLRVILR